MRTWQELVADYYKEIRGDPPETPSLLPPDHKRRRAEYIAGELVEFACADTLEDQVDALCDMLYFILGTAEVMGVDLDPHFREVHAANERKRFPNGRFKLEKGRIVKPDDWRPPDHKGLLSK